MSQVGEKMRIAVTGGSGLIGRGLIRELLSRGHEVWNLDRRNFRDSPVRHVYVDLRQREQVQPIFEQVQAVIHLGEIPTPYVTLSYDEIYSHNTRVASVVFQTSADLKLRRVVYASTCQVYGCWGEAIVPPVTLPLDETHPLQPQSIYSLSKVANERYAHFTTDHFGLSIAMFRLPQVIQDAEPSERWCRTVDNFGGRIVDFGTYVHVTDAAKALALAVESDRGGCEAYHLSAAEVASAQPIRERLAEFHPDFPLLPSDWPKYKSPMILDKVKNHFGWEPRWNFFDFFRRKYGRDPIGAVKG